MKPALILLAFTLAPAIAQVKITQVKERIAVEIDGRPFTAFYVGAETTKPFLHPLRSASGKIVTRRYPMEKLAGEATDHPHQRGLWFTHGDVNGYDFWANEPSQKGVGKGKGKIVLKSLGELKSEPRSGSIDAVFEWQYPDGKAMLTESRRMVFYAMRTMRMIDFDITLKAAERVVFGDTKEGTFAMRLAAELEEPSPKSIPEPPRTGKMVNAEGGQTEKEVWGKRSPWVDYCGAIAGEKLGIAILDHPENPRHPTYWHSRGYGLFAANIFGVHDFTNDKNVNAALTLAPGEELRFRYRVIIHSGDTETARIAALFAKYKELK